MSAYLEIQTALKVINGYAKCAEIFAEPGIKTAALDTRSTALGYLSTVLAPSSEPIKAAAEAVQTVLASRAPGVKTASADLTRHASENLATAVFLDRVLTQQMAGHPADYEKLSAERDLGREYIAHLTETIVG